MIFATSYIINKTASEVTIAVSVYDFGLRLRELREKQNLTQKQVADKLDISESAVSSYERNIAQPSSEALKVLAILYRTKADFILGLENRNYILADGLTEKQQEAIETLIAELTKQAR